MTKTDMIAGFPDEVRNDWIRITGSRLEITFGELTLCPVPH
jgi:hypothetical protein